MRCISFKTCLHVKKKKKKLRARPVGFPHLPCQRDGSSSAHSLSSLPPPSGNRRPSRSFRRPGKAGDRAEDLRTQKGGEVARKNRRKGGLGLGRSFESPKFFGRRWLGAAKLQQGGGRTHAVTRLRRLRYGRLRYGRLRHGRHGRHGRL